LIYLFTIERVAKHYNFKTHAPKLDDISNLHFITLSKYNEEIIYFVDKTGRITIQVFNNVPDLHWRLLSFFLVVIHHRSMVKPIIFYTFYGQY